MHGVPIIISDEQSILMLPMNHSPIPIRKNLEANELKKKSSNAVESRLDLSYSLIQNTVGNSVIVKISYLIAINCVDASA